MFEQPRVATTPDTVTSSPDYLRDRVPPIIERLTVLNRYRLVIFWTLLLAVGGALLATYNEAVIQAATTRAQKGAVHDQVRHLDPNSDEAASFPAVANDPEVRAARAQLVALQADHARSSQRYGVRHPTRVKSEAAVVAAASQLKEEVGRARTSIGVQYESAVAEEQTLRAELDAQKNEAVALNRKRVDYSVLERDALSERQVYQDLIRREKEVGIENNLTKSQGRVVDHAAVPDTPFTPNGRRNLFQGLIVGFVLSLALAFGLDAVTDTINTPDDVMSKLNLPLLGLVPAAAIRVP